MRLSAGFLFAFFFVTITASAQQLDFLGLNGIHFGMKIKELPGPQLMLDSSSSYTDTAVYLANSRCQMYYSRAQNLQLAGFNASKVEYEFCDSALSYVFVTVIGKDEIDKALATLKVHFTKMGCGKNVPLGSCSLIDTKKGNLRMILRINHETNEMSFVIIPKKAAG
jgi:hypothetical protein